MGRSRLGWAASVVAPWCLAIGVLISITAEAGQEPPQSGSVADRRALIEAGDPIRAAIALAQRQRAVDEAGVPTPLVMARFAVGDPGDFGVPDEIEPNRALKDKAPPLPSVDRSGKGDPFFELRPGFDARKRSGPGEPDPNAFQSWPPEVQDPRDAEFDPGHAMSPMRPADRPESGASSFSDGATPPVPLDFALNSSTPTASDGVLVVVEVDPSQPDTTVVPKSP